MEYENNQAVNLSLSETEILEGLETENNQHQVTMDFLRNEEANTSPTTVVLYTNAQNQQFENQALRLFLFCGNIWTKDSIRLKPRMQVCIEN
ncbi:hypothetical protein DMENIID0001_001700 [Sergentomyia squamirostris]